MFQRFFIFMVLGALIFSTINTLYSDDTVIAHSNTYVSGLLNEYYNEFDQPFAIEQNYNYDPSQAQLKNVLSNYYSELLK